MERGDWGVAFLRGGVRPALDPMALLIVSSGKWVTSSAQASCPESGAGTAAPQNRRGGEMRPPLNDMEQMLSEGVVVMLLTTQKWRTL